MNSGGDGDWAFASCDPCDPFEPCLCSVFFLFFHNSWKDALVKEEDIFLLIVSTTCFLFACVFVDFSFVYKFMEKLL